MTKIISYNINGYRAAIKKGFEDWALAMDADIICLQETKATLEQIEIANFEKAGYFIQWNAGSKKGHKGVAVFSKIKADKTHFDLYNALQEDGRVITVYYKRFILINVYMPSGSSSENRQVFKLDWIQSFKKYIKELMSTGIAIIINGDFNICHTQLDIHNPKMSEKTPGFTKEEKEWFTDLLNLGFIDSFRNFNTKTNNFTWWSYRTKARDRNKGWRIDYQLVSSCYKNKIIESTILNDVKHSDHCPILLELK